MSISDKVDVIIFGATGFTGKYVVREFISFNEGKYTWAIAGRNQKILQEVLEWVTAKTGRDVTCVPVIVCDCEDEDSLNQMARKGRVVINCCGPYRLYGEPVVKACIENGTHHVDISGEQEYIEWMQVDYHEAAMDKGVYVVSACGFDCVPCDFGVIHFKNNFSGQVNSIESFMKISSEAQGSALNIGTWKSAVHETANEQWFAAIRKPLHLTFNKSKLEPRLKSRWIIHRNELFNNAYGLPFPGVDGQIVYRTQMFLNKYYKQRPIQHKAYFVVPSLIILTTLMFIGLFLQIFSKFSFGRQLLLQFPEFFSFGMISKNGPSEADLINSRACFKFKGEGWTEEVANQYENKEEINVPPNKKMLTEMYFTSSFYGFTSKSVILSALTILEESDKMPFNGGVYTPGGAFFNTSFLANLLKQDVIVKVEPVV